MPNALQAEHAARIVASCDRSTPAGCRDYAILMLLARLGLRGCEIARLLLEDLDWRAGEVIVRGKRQYYERLPLPVAVGEALVDCLRHGRPESADRHVFLTAARPFVSLKQEEYGVVGRIVLRASEPGRSRPGRRAPLAANGRDRGAAGWRAVGGDRVAAAPSRLRDDDGVREGRLGPAQKARPPMAGSAGMTALHEAVSDYLTIRRALGSL